MSFGRSLLNGYISPAAELQKHLNREMEIERNVNNKTSGTRAIARATHLENARDCVAPAFSPNLLSTVTAHIPAQLTDLRCGDYWRPPVAGTSLNLQPLGNSFQNAFGAMGSTITRIFGTDQDITGTHLDVTNNREDNPQGQRLSGPPRNPEWCNGSNDGQEYIAREVWRQMIYPMLYLKEEGIINTRTYMDQEFDPREVVAFTPSSTITWDDGGTETEYRESPVHRISNHTSSDNGRGRRSGDIEETSWEISLMSLRQENELAIMEKLINFHSRRYP